MATPILRGTDEPQLQYLEINFDRNTGTTASKEFKGISFNKMAALAQLYGVAGWRGTLRSEFGVATLKLTGTNSGGLGFNSPVSDITDKWEITVDQERPDLCENYNFLSAFSAADAFYASATSMPNSVSQQFFSVLRSVASGGNRTRKELKEKLSVKLVDVAGNTAVVGANGVSLHDIIYAYGIPANIIHFIDDYLRGATSFARGKYVLRHVTNAPGDYAANVADENVETIYSIAELLSEVEDSNLWILPLPGYLAYKINSYPAPAYLPDNYMWGALKMRSSATSAAQGRIEISTEYLIDAWPIHTYGTL